MSGGLSEIIRLSRLYGGDPELVLAGGGNTSYKENGALWVKASGAGLAKIGEEGFVGLSMERLLGITEKAYSPDEKTAEAQVLADMMAARLEGQEGRPSVEALLHALFSQKFVVHLHPAAVNALTCSKQGRAAAAEIFGKTAVWLDEVKPGYTLAMAAKAGMDAFGDREGRPADLLIMQNHGIFFAGESPGEISELIGDSLLKIKKRIKFSPETGSAEFETENAAVDSEKAAFLAPAVRALTGYAFAGFFAAGALSALPETDGGLSCAFTPDHIVYCGHEYCSVPEFSDGEEQLGALEREIAGFREKNGYAPRIVLVRGLGAFACGDGLKALANARELFLDFAKIYSASESFGGPRFMAPEMIEFIRGWEVESYRSKVSGGGAAGRLAGKSAVITGGAQGFGAGIADEMAAAGAAVVIADINLEGAKSFAAALCEKYGKGAAIAVEADVSREDSVKVLCEKAATAFGGIDIFVSNAGILRSGGLWEMDAKTFELMTKVNYTGFFLCAKHAAAVMRNEGRHAPGKFFDIIQVNSKSGLSGSNRNFAYAGGKFGGIGLVQSFALELVGYNIKVNAVCPGNFFEGPLWNDPEKGLFVQYLRSGKVPGAKTVGDVRRAYEAKAPMKRGCGVKDVARAIFYLVEQEYETGQALPVTGGQIMLK